MAAWDIFGRAASPARTATLAGALLLGAAGPLLPRPAAAQAVHNVHLTGGNDLATAAATGERLRFEAWAGALWDAYRNDGGSGAPAWIGAIRLGFEMGDGFGPGFRLIGEVARAEAADAGTAVVGDSIEVDFATRWWLTTAGVEWDVVGGGWTGLTLEAQGGAAWLMREVTGGDAIPPGTPGTTPQAEADPFPAGRIGLSAWRYLTHTIQLRLRAEDVVTDGFDGIEHSPALGVGVRLVFE